MTTPTPEQTRRFLSTSQAAELLGISDTTLYRQIRADAFPAVKIGTRYIIPMKAIDAMESDALSKRGVVDASDYVVRRRNDPE